MTTNVLHLADATWQPCPECRGGRCYYCDFYGGWYEEPEEVDPPEDFDERLFLARSFFQPGDLAGLGQSVIGEILYNEWEPAPNNDLWDIPL
jgi:hypothetical protein